MATPRRDLTFRVFISSTFRDMEIERAALQSDAFPWLQEYCRTHGGHFRPIDLRWGVTEEAFYEQQAIPICVNEIRRCQVLSPRPNFIVLLGQRYGARPLPTYIDAMEFENILSSTSGSDKDRLKTWYRRDDNAVPSQYCLLCREGVYRDAQIWEEEEVAIRLTLIAGLERIGGAPSAFDKYLQSATQHEIQCGALDPQTDADRHVYAYIRNITGASIGAATDRYIDEEDGKKQLDALKNAICARLPKKHIYRYDAPWHGDKPETDLNALCDRVKADLKRIIDDELAAYFEVSQSSRECLAHRDIAQEHCQHFVGRIDQLDRIREYLASDVDTPLVVHGPSGTGKTAIMAKAWRDATVQAPLIRFIGATSESTDLRSLLRSFCEEMGCASPPYELHEIVRLFRNCLSASDSTAAGEHVSREGSIVLFLDGLDQLHSSPTALSLSWIPRKLARGIKIVVSVRDDATEVQYFDIANARWENSTVRVGELDEASGAALLQLWLGAAGRTLQREQRDEVIYKFARDGNPLYLKLAFEEVRRWQSWQRPARELVSLGESIKGIFESLFDRLEREHGQTLVTGALRCIACGKHGLAEDELIEVLSEDRELMDHFHQSSPSELAIPVSERTERLPFVIWSRLRWDLQAYIRDRRADGTIVLGFYHRQFREGVQQRYLSESAILTNIHIALAGYFVRGDYYADRSLAEHDVQGHSGAPRPVNIRKVAELPYQLIEAAKSGGELEPSLWDAVGNLLCDWTFLEAKAAADPDLRTLTPRKF